MANLTVNVVNWPHVGVATFIRVIAGSNAAASSVFCRPITGAATMNVTSNNKLTVGNFYRAEIFSDLGGAAGVFDPGAGNTNDHDYRTGSITAVAGGNTFSIDHNQTAGPLSFVDTTWVAATACPGD